MTGYECPKCKKTHQMNSNIGRRHYSLYLKHQEFEDKRAEELRLIQVVPSSEETTRKLYEAIFGPSTGNVKELK